MRTCLKHWGCRVENFGDSEARETGLERKCKPATAVLRIQYLRCSVLGLFSGFLDLKPYLHASDGCLDAVIARKLSGSFREVAEVDALRGASGESFPQVLVHALREEGSEGCHHLQRKVVRFENRILQLYRI